MKNLFFPLLVLATIIMSSCSTKFNVAAPYKAITVVYGLLDQADTAHYVIIQKAFLDQNKSSVVMAQTPDSSYYPLLDVKIERLLNGVLFDTIHLTRVDLNAEGYTKQGGAFFTSPNYAYKFTNLLDPNYTYQLVVTNPVTGEVDSAETLVIDDIDKTVFELQQIDDSFPLPAYTFDFSSTIPASRTVTLSASYNLPTTIPTNPVGFAECIIRFRWVDSNVLNNSETHKYVDDDLGYATSSNGTQINYQPSDLSLYFAIRSGMGTASTYTARLIDSCDISFYLGTSDLYNYYQNTLTQGVGLTGSDIEPNYTNVHGANVLGLFTSRAFRTKRVPISDATVDSLVISPYMQGDNIVGKTMN